MKIVVLDGHAVNPGDLSWDVLKQFGDYTVYDRTPAESVIQRIQDADAVLLNKVKITREIILSCPKLKYIGVQATGYNVVDLAACREAGIVVTNVPAYSTTAVAQHTFALLLALTNKVKEHSDSVLNGDWVTCPDFCYWNSSLTELDGKIMGIYGYGHIGRRVAQIANAFGMKVLVCAHHQRPEYTVELVSKEELFRRSDVISLHAPLTQETQNLVNKDTLSLCKDSAILLNTARGGLVDEKALSEALSNNKIAAYGADTVQEEPMNEKCPLLKAPRCLITPHLAWAPRETRQRLLNQVIANLSGFISGKIINQVN